MNDEEQRLLAARASVRSLYEEVGEAAGDWRLPAIIREDLGNWAFTEAREGLEVADDLLAARDRIEREAARLELETSDRLQRAFEGDEGLDAATGLAQVELAALADLAVAQERLDREPSPLETIGLLGSEPGLLLDRARDAYEAGELGGARRAAAGALAARNAAVDEGRTRVVLGASLLLALDGLALSTATAIRLRRLRRWEMRVHGT